MGKGASPDVPANVDLQIPTTASLPIQPSRLRYGGNGAAGQPSRIDAEIVSFEPSDRDHVALLIGDWDRSSAPLVRIHSECLTGDVFGSLRCDCGPQLAEAIDLMSRLGGVILYLRQEGRGIGLYNKLKAYELQEQGLDTYAANRALQLPEDGREFYVAGGMLRALGISRCRLISNNPAKPRHLAATGIEIVEQWPTGVYLNASNQVYLRTKVRHGGHRMDVPPDTPAMEPTDEQQEDR